MDNGFDLNAYLEASTKASGVPLKVKHSKTVKQIRRLLRSR